MTDNDLIERLRDAQAEGVGSASLFNLIDEAAAALEAARAKARIAPPSAPVGVEEMQRRLDREESDHGRTIDQRDAAEDALGRMFQAVTGRAAEWSSAWGYVDAIEEVEEHVAALAQQPAAVDELESLPDFLDRIAGELVSRDTRAGTFAPGIAESLRGRAIILRTFAQPGGSDAAAMEARDEA